MYYSDEIVDSVRSANDIVDVISSYVTLQKRGNNYFGLCPFHNEKTPSFSVSASKQIYYCFGCGAGGNAINFLMNYESYTFEEALKSLADRAGITLPTVQPTAEERRKSDARTRLLDMHRLAANYYYHQLREERGKTGLKYFSDRGLTPDTMRSWGLGYASKGYDELYRLLKKEGYDDEIIAQSGLATVEEKGSHDKFYNRVMFPIMDVNNKVIGFGGRVIGTGEPKYLNSPESMIFDKSHTLYGLNYARRSRRDFMLLCEGYMDVISLHQAGFTNAVASLGTSLTSGHAGLLKRYVNKVVITYDSDGAGQKAALRAIPILKEAGITARILNMSPYKDPDEFIKNLGPEEYEKRIAAADNSFIWELGVIRKNYDMSDPQQKTDFEHAAAGRLTAFTDRIERENYVRAVSDRFMIPYRPLLELVNALGEKGYREQGGDNAPAPVRRQRREPDAGLKKAQTLLISCIAEEPSLSEKVSGYLSPDDFTEGIYREIAAEILRPGGLADAARLMDVFMDDPEKQRSAAEIMNSPIEAELTREERISAAEDAVGIIRRASLKAQADACTDIAAMQEIMNMQALWQRKKAVLR